MDTQNLRAFLLVAEQGSFSAAAAEPLHHPARGQQTYRRPRSSNWATACSTGSAAASCSDRGRSRPAAPRRGHQRPPAPGRQKPSTTSPAKSAGACWLGTSHHIGLHRLPPVLRRYSEALSGRGPGHRLHGFGAGGGRTRPGAMSSWRWSPQRRSPRPISWQPRCGTTPWTSWPPPTIRWQGPGKVSRCQPQRLPGDPARHEHLHRASCGNCSRPRS